MRIPLVGIWRLPAAGPLASLHRTLANANQRYRVGKRACTLSALARTLGAFAQAGKKEGYLRVGKIVPAPA